MKKQLFILLSGGLLWMTSCDHILHEKSKQAYLSGHHFDEEAMLRETYLAELAEILLHAEKSPDFKRKFYREMDKRQGKSSVLFRSLIADTGDPNPLRIPPLDHKVEKTLLALENVSGKNYHPQIFVPFYKELKMRNAVGSGTPFLVIYTGKDSGQAHPGYRLNKDGLIIKTDVFIDAKYASQHEVWVISLYRDEEKRRKKSPGIEKFAGIDQPGAPGNGQAVRQADESPLPASVPTGYLW